MVETNEVQDLAQFANDVVSEDLNGGSVSVVETKDGGRKAVVQGKLGTLDRIRRLGEEHNLSIVEEELVRLEFVQQN